MTNKKNPNLGGPKPEAQLQELRLGPTATGARPVDIAAAVSAMDLPTYRDLLPELRERLLSLGYLAIILIDLSEVSRIAQGQSSRTYDRMMDLLGSEIVQVRGAELHRDDLIALSENAGDAVIVFLAPREGNELFAANFIEHLAERIQGVLNQRLTSITLRGIRTGARVKAGSSLIIHNPLIQVTRLLQKGVDEARHLAYLNRLYQEARDKQRLQHFILKEDVRTVFQPIVELESHNVHGFEALARGPRQTDLESPLALFDMASKSDLLFELDQVCRYNSVKRAESLKSPNKLFINTLPFSIRDPHFRGKFLLDLLDGSKLVPERIVLEVTETLAIEDYTAYLEEMRYFSDMGFLTAIDDMGAGHSGLEKVVQLRPDYLKLDMHMVRDIDASLVKQDIMRAFCTMAKDIGAAVVAEGVETRAELETVQELGADYVQGYYLARPAEGFQTTLNDEF